jgi:aminoglycoside 2''-phosphotransferase
LKIDILLQRIQSNFPNLTWRSYQHLTRGWDHDVIILDNQAVFRFPKKRAYRVKLPYEIYLLEYLRNRTRVGVPAYQYIPPDWSFAGYRILRGKELTPYRYKHLTQSEKQQFIRQIAEFINALHKTPDRIIKKFRPWSDNYKRWYAVLRQESRKLLWPRLQKHERGKVDCFFSEWREHLEDQYPKRLIHSDLGGEHILWDNIGKQVNVIDFSDRMYGDPALDFTGLAECYGIRLAQEVYTLYECDTDDNLWERVKLYVKGIPINLMIDALHGFPITFDKGYRMLKRIYKL